jgi:hypothetical protein
VKKPVSKFAFQMQPAALHYGAGIGGNRGSPSRYMTDDTAAAPPAQFDASRFSAYN